MEERRDWDDMPEQMHVHMYQTEVEVAGKMKHQHVIMGISQPAEKEGSTHVHRLKGYTSYYMEEECQHGHWHVIDLMTMRAEELCEDGHVHYFYGTTSMNDGHCHRFKGSTGLGMMDCWCEEEYEDCQHHCHKPKENECCEDMMMPCKMKKHDMEEPCCDDVMIYKKKKHDMEEECCDDMHYKKKKKREE